MRRIGSILIFLFPLLSLLSVGGAFLEFSAPPLPDESILRAQLHRYPGMEAVDLYKLTLQAAAGPGHLGTSRDHILH